METRATKELFHGNTAHEASHPSFGLRREAFVWEGDRPVAPNLVSLAAEMCDWLGRARTGLSLQSRHFPADGPTYSNPYTFHASSIGASLMHIINSALDFTESREPTPAFEAEVARLRLHTELVLYVSRFCEATMKQMLFCTTIPRRLYHRASLGGLLAVDCDRCRKQFREGQDVKTHAISLLGALAHRYFLCPTLESCVFDHLALVGTARNVQAAHSDAIDLNVRDDAASRADLATSVKEISYGLRHMAQHIGEIELRMLGEIELRLDCLPNAPTAQQLMDVWTRPNDSEVRLALAARKHLS